MRSSVFLIASVLLLVARILLWCGEPAPVVARPRGHGDAKGRRISEYLSVGAAFVIVLDAERTEACASSCQAALGTSARILYAIACRRPLEPGVRTLWDTRAWKPRRVFTCAGPDVERVDPAKAMRVYR